MKWDCRSSRSDPIPISTTSVLEFLTRKRWIECDSSVPDAEVDSEDQDEDVSMFDMSMYESRMNRPTEDAVGVDVDNPVHGAAVGSMTIDANERPTKRQRTNSN